MITGIFIPGFELPKRCEDCRFVAKSPGWPDICIAKPNRIGASLDELATASNGNKRSDCPLRKIKIKKER